MNELQTGRGFWQQGNELQTTVEQSAELAAVSAASKERAEIESSIIIAKKMRRNEDECWQKVNKACQRQSFAEKAAYSFPRGDKEVTGPSVDLAREAARCWGNIRFGLRILRDDETSRLIQGWCWDLETNMKNEFEDSFEKLIQRKNKHTKQTEWVEPDERDLRELTNRRGAILVRNAILQTIPKDMVEDALYQCEKTLQDKAKADPDATRKRLLADFGSMNITVSMIEGTLGHPLDQATPKELADLRAIYNSIIAGNSTWQEYAKSTEPSADSKPKADLNEQLAKQSKPQEHASTATVTHTDELTSPPSSAPGSGGPVGHMTLEEWYAMLRYLDGDNDRRRVKNKAKATIGLKTVDKLETVKPGRYAEFIEQLLQIGKQEGVQIAF